VFIIDLFALWIVWALVSFLLVWSVCKTVVALVYACNQGVDKVCNHPSTTF